MTVLCKMVCNGVSLSRAAGGRVAYFDAIAGASENAIFGTGAPDCRLSIAIPNGVEMPFVPSTEYYLSFGTSTDGFLDAATFGAKVVTTYRSSSNRGLPNGAVEFRFAEDADSVRIDLDMTMTDATAIAYLGQVTGLSMSPV